MRFNKLLAMFIAVMLLFTSANITSANVIPGGFPDISESPHSRAILYLKALGTLKGDGGTGNFRPNDNLSRQEFVVIISRLATSLEDNESLANQRLGDPIPGIDITVNQSPGGSPPPPPPPPPPANAPPTNTFTDLSVISDWAMDSVTYVTEKGWVKGYLDGSFRPRNNLTHAEAITVLLRVLGYEVVINTSNWPSSYLAKANDLGMAYSLELNPSAPITRAEMARLTYNSLFIPRILEESGSLISSGSLIQDLDDSEIPDKLTFGDTMTFFIGDLDSDGYGDVLKVYKDVISPSGEPVELWRIFKLINEIENDLSDNSDGSTQRLADLKKLADELRNLFDINTGDSDGGEVDFDLDSEPAQLIADLKKLADELVNSYSLAEDVVLIGADSLDDLIGLKVRATFDDDENVIALDSNPYP